MTELTGMRCTSCGKGTVARRAMPGRRTSYLQIPDLELPHDLEIESCDACATFFIDSDEDAKAVDDGLERAYAAAVTKRSIDALDRLVADGCRQRNLEKLLGVSAGYLSKVRAGKETSPLLASCLTLMAADVGRVDELRRAWRTTPSVTAEATSSTSVDLPSNVVPFRLVPGTQIDGADLVGTAA